MQATMRFRQQFVNDRVEVFDACERHADWVRAQLERRHAERPDVVLHVLEATPPLDAACPYDGAECCAHGCDRHDGLVMATVEDGQLMGT